MCLVLSANVLDVRQHPVLHEGDPDASNGGSDDLDHEHDARRDLHVVAELEISCKADGLVGDDEADGLEEDVGDGSAWEHVSGDELVHDLRGHLLVGDGLQHSERNGKDRSDEDSNDSGPDWELSRDDLDGDAEECEGDDADDDVPPVRDLGVVLHKTRVHIALVLERAAETADNIFAEPH